MKNIKKISLIVIIIFAIGVIFANNVQAIGDIFEDADEFLGKGEPVGSKIDLPQLRETSNFLYKLLVAIGIVVMFIVGTILGIQFMVASAEDKAKVKEALVPYVVGCFVIFGAFSIWSLVVNIGQDGVGGAALSKEDSNVYIVFQCINPDCQNCNGRCPVGTGKRDCPYCPKQPRVVIECRNCPTWNAKAEIEKNNGNCKNCGTKLKLGYAIAELIYMCRDETCDNRKNWVELGDDNFCDVCEKPGVAVYKCKRCYQWNNIDQLKDSKLKDSNNTCYGCMATLVFTD